MQSTARHGDQVIGFEDIRVAPAKVKRKLPETTPLILSTPWV
jgi:hypothetical protein